MFIYTLAKFRLRPETKLNKKGKYETTITIMERSQWQEDAGLQFCKRRLLLCYRSQFRSLQPDCRRRFAVIGWR